MTIQQLLDLTFFFFQAEDGIRDRNVTGVQTCALPIYLPFMQMPKNEVAQFVCDRESAPCSWFIAINQHIRKATNGIKGRTTVGCLMIPKRETGNQHPDLDRKSVV